MRRQAAISATLLCFFTLAAVAAPVMPFNPHSITHAFQKNQTGGIQQITAKDPNDKDLIAAIRTHLEAEAERFGNGQYSDPAWTHGKAMPGVKYLNSIKPGQMAITYRNVPGGAAVDYVGNDAATIDAIHKWLDAEISDQE